MSIDFSDGHLDEHDTYVKRYESKCVCARCHSNRTPASDLFNNSCGTLQTSINLGCFETMETDLEVSEAQTRSPRMPGAWDTD